MSFESRGWVSVWLGLSEWSDEDKKKDTLRDGAGVDYYDVDFQDNVIAPAWKPTSVRDLIEQLSYSKSYLDKAIAAAEKKGIGMACQAVSQLHFKYDPAKVTRGVSDNFVFLGAFKFSKL